VRWTGAGRLKSRPVGRLEGLAGSPVAPRGVLAVWGHLWPSPAALPLPAGAPALPLHGAVGPRLRAWPVPAAGRCRLSPAAPGELSDGDAPFALGSVGCAAQLERLVQSGGKKQKIGRQ
jgi:hypothetical protein